MKSCTFDNPSTMCREQWVDGQLKAHFSAVLIESKHFNKTYMPRPFIKCHVIGDIEAIAEEYRPK
jgi:hypothetical protein